jgi:hypothetical protein
LSDDKLLDSCSSSLCMRSCSLRLGVEVFGGESFEKVMVCAEFRELRNVMVCIL